MAGAIGLAGCAWLACGCSSPAASSAPGAGAGCGTTKTAAGVPVIVKIAAGDVACGTAMSIENQYAALIRSGRVPGNGGGAPVTVGGWTCQGYPTPQVLRTGDASQCHDGRAEILAVLPAPSGAAMPSARPSVTPSAGESGVCRQLASTPVMICTQPSSLNPEVSG